MEGEYDNISGMKRLMVKEGCDIEKRADNRKEDRRWVINDVRMSIEGRKKHNREYRNMIRLCGVNDDITLSVKMRYLQKKDETQGLSYRTLHGRRAKEYGNAEFE